MRRLAGQYRNSVRFLVAALALATLALADGWFEPQHHALAHAASNSEASERGCVNPGPVELYLEFDDDSKNRAAIGRVREDCSIETLVIELTAAEHDVLVEQGTLPSDAFSRADISHTFGRQQRDASISSTAEHSSVDYGLFPASVGTTSASGKITACSKVLWWCSDVAHLQAGFTFGWNDPYVTSYYGESKAAWTNGSCWDVVSGPTGSWLTQSLPYFIHYGAAAEYLVQPYCTAGLTVGGTMSVKPTGIGSGNTALSCIGNLSGPMYSFEYACTPS